MSHGIVKCRNCGKVIAQCRCMDHKEVTYSVCPEGCRPHQTVAGDEMEEFARQLSNLSGRARKFGGDYDDYCEQDKEVFRREARSLIRDGYRQQGKLADKYAENKISLLHCMMEEMNVPVHDKSCCGTNKCSRCNWEVWATDYLKLSNGLYWLDEYIGHPDNPAQPSVPSVEQVYTQQEMDDACTVRDTKIMELMKSVGKVFCDSDWLSLVERVSKGCHENPDGKIYYEINKTDFIEAVRLLTEQKG